MTPRIIKELLNSVKTGAISVNEAVERLRFLPFQNLDHARVDHHRELRQGMPEVIFGAGKTVSQIIDIMAAMAKTGSNILVTRLSQENSEDILERFSGAEYHAEACCLTFEKAPVETRGRGEILVISAGTSDIPVAAEAVVTARFLGNNVSHLYDVGVSGVHRLLAHHEALCSAAVIIVVAGMEGALPSVVGGLVDKPIIAVPTSVGYGASFGGVAALLGMLNSCASGVTVVNIDNGFGAACAASLMNRI